MRKLQNNKPIRIKIQIANKKYQTNTNSSLTLILPPLRRLAAVHFRDKFAESSQYWRSYPSNTWLILDLNLSPTLINQRRNKKLT